MESFSKKRALIKSLIPLAEQGDLEVQLKLGRIYDEGEGVPINYKEAAKWYRRAANQGHARAQFFLGGMYYKGDGVTQVVIQELI